MNRRLSGALTCAAALPLVLAGCGLFAGGGRADLELVAGGGEDPRGTTGETIRLDGYPIDFAVGGATAYLLADDVGGERRLLGVGPEGTVTDFDLPAESVRYVAAGPDVLYVATEETIYRAAGEADFEQVATARRRSAQDADLASVQGLAVDGSGGLVWTESFFGTAHDGSEPLLARVMRLDDGDAELVAGAASVDAEAEFLDRPASYPRDEVASELPMRNAGMGRAVAAGDDGTVYVGGTRAVYGIGVDGKVSVVVGPGERAPADNPFADEHEAASFGGSWGHTSMDAAGGAVVAVESSFRHEAVDVKPFDWRGDLGEGAQRVADTIVRWPAADGSYNLDKSSTLYEDVAVVVHGGAAATVMAHVSKVALEDGVLYVVGQTRERSSSHTDDAQMLIVKTELPENWR